MVWRSGPADSDSIWASRRSRLAAATAVKSGRTVVSGGMKYAASGTSSNPTTLMSSGTRRPCSCSARSTPSARWSFAVKTAVTSGIRASICPHR